MRRIMTKKSDVAFWVKDRLKHQISIEMALDLLDGLVDEVGMLPPYNDLFYTSDIAMDTPFEWESEE